jgi:hypothetical protein
MERITITIATGGAAFEDAPASEIGRILRSMANYIEEGGRLPEKIYDLFGNACGTASITKVEG